MKLLLFIATDGVVSLQHKAYWQMMSPKIAQIALRFGADDIDGTVIEEKIYHDAGATTPQGLRCSELERLLREAGSREPVERDTLYRPVVRTETSFTISVICLRYRQFGLSVHSPKHARSQNSLGSASGDRSSGMRRRRRVACGGTQSGTRGPRAGPTPIPAGRTCGWRL